MNKRTIMKSMVAAVFLAVAILVTLGGSNVQAHKGGHQNGCEEFGGLASDLAGPGFGQFHREFTPKNPGDNADMVENFGHAMCD